MGDFTLGCLLGKSDKAQSFDISSIALTTRINSWELGSVASFNFTTEVHSSKQGLQIDVFSNDVTERLMSYPRTGVIHDRWFTEIDTHLYSFTGFGRITTAASSGQILFETLTVFAGFGENKAIPFNDELQKIDYNFLISSGEDTDPIDTVQRFTDASSCTVIIDDILTRVDEIILHPDWNYQNQHQLIETRGVSIGGKSEYFKYGEFYDFQIPLFFISTSHANLMNFWWEEKFELLYTENTSNESLMRIVRIRDKPFNSFITGTGLYRGNLTLESVTNGLVF